MKHGAKLDTSKLEQLRARSVALGKVAVRFGSMGPGGSPAPMHPGSDLNVAEVLQIHEFGLGVPERSVVRAVANGKRDDLAKALRAAASMALAGTTIDAARVVGERAAELLQERHDALGYVTGDDGLARPALDETGAIRRSLGWAKS